MKRDIRKSGIVLLAGLLWQWPGAARSDDHGDDPANATLLDIGGVVAGVLNAAEDAFAALKREGPGLAPVDKLAFLAGGQR